MNENHAKISQNIGKILSSMSVEKSNLSTLAKKGEDVLVQQFLSEHVSVRGEQADTSQSQLYMASFWGIYDAVKVLVEAGNVDVNRGNGTSGWTPLHAATFQEHGKVVMYLLENQANPNAQDVKGRTPAHFASVSDKVWPLFAASGFNRSSETELIAKCVLRRPENDSVSLSMRSGDMDMNSIRNEESVLPINFQGGVDPEHGGKVDRNAHAACVDGDVLAGDVTTFKSRDVDCEEPNFNAWRN